MGKGVDSSLQNVELSESAEAKLESNDYVQKNYKNKIQNPRKLTLKRRSENNAPKRDLDPAKNQNLHKLDLSKMS